MQIVGVAMRMIGGDTVISAPAPERHVHLIHGLADPLDWEQGFITCGGDFVNRVEAMKIAQAAGQKFVRPPYNDELFSENLW
mgnify:CR=1 FL=1